MTSVSEIERKKPVPTAGDGVMAQVTAAKDGARQVADNFSTAMQKSLDKNPVATMAMLAAVAFVMGALWKS